MAVGKEVAVGTSMDVGKVVGVKASVGNGATVTRATSRELIIFRCDCVHDENNKIEIIKQQMLKLLIYIYVSQFILKSPSLFRKKPFAYCMAKFIDVN